MPPAQPPRRAPCSSSRNLPDAASAEALANALIDQRLAACVNMLAPCTSVYRWQGATGPRPRYRC